MVIQQLLVEAGTTDHDHELVSVEARGAEAPADWATLRSPENYTGYARTENFAPPGGILPGQPHHYTPPAELRLNHWALAGDWTIQEEAARLDTADGRIACRFQARDLNLVMGPAAPGTPTRFRVLLDGQPPGPDHGTDVDDHGSGTLAGQRLYQLVRQHGPVTERTFQITFPDPRRRSLRLHLRVDQGRQAMRFSPCRTPSTTHPRFRDTRFCQGGTRLTRQNLPRSHATAPVQGLPEG
jgi:hypothetical protein